ncbi:MAG TPA: hypothetical protein PLV45_17475 [bacterium]|nr:hypothetical protein [bacterium]
MNRKSFPNPLEELTGRIIPAARHAILLIDPSPSDAVIDALIQKASPRMTIRVLIRKDILNIGDAVPPEILKPETRRMIQDRRIEVRAMGNLSARLVIVDDAALVISGQPGSDLCWGVELNAVDAQPLIEFWEDRYGAASRISDSFAVSIWDSYREKFWSGSVDPRDIVALYNSRGTFIDVQVRIFSGHRQVTLHPFSASTRDGPRGPVVRWRLVHRRHYQAIGRQAARIHGLKSLGIIRDTPAGPYLPRSEAGAWDRLFREREQEFREFVSEYLDAMYDTMRREAMDDLLEQFFSAFDELAANRQLLPMLNREFVEEQAREIHHRQFPEKQILQFACQARYILYGLHPDAASDRTLMDQLAASVVSDVLL